MNGTSKSEMKELPSATYRSIPDKEMEAETAARSKSAIKTNTKESDGADERMLPKEEVKVSPNSEISLKEIKIVMGETNGDAKVDDVEQLKEVFGGMTKEELLKYANDPFWVRLRWFLFVAFWLLWAGMLIGAVMIIYAAPKCDPPPPRTWWQVGPLAEINQDIKAEELKSMDKNLKGLIISWLGDAYKPLDENDDIVKLIKQCKELDTKVIIDLDPSTSQVWFEKSEGNDDAFKDYYIWQQPKYNGTVPTPPNNWLSRTNNSSWTFSLKRSQYFYAPLEYPHLNFRNQLVVKEFSDVITKLMEYGASGIRIRNAPILLVDPKLEDDNVFTKKAGVEIGEAGFFVPTKTTNLFDLGKLLLNWKEVIAKNTQDGLLMVSEELVKVQSYQVDDNLVVDLPLVSNIFHKPNVTAIVNKLNQLFNVDNVKWPLWKENSSSLPSDVVSIVTNLLPGARLISFNATIDPKLIKIRESPSIMRGHCDMYAVSDNTVFAFVREIAGNPGVLVALNTGDQKIILNVKRDIPSLPDLDEVTIQYYSQNYNEPDYKDINAKKDASSIPLSSKSVLVLQYVPKKKP